MNTDRVWEPRFWAKVDKRGPDECWPWLGTKQLRMRYGKMRVGTQHISAHRISWMIAHDQEIPGGMVVLHSCDRGDCVNPAHLSLGTQKQNIQDCWERGRHDLRGERNTMAKLTDDAVRAIRANPEGLSMRDMAERHGVSKSLICVVWQGKRWAHVT